MSNYVSKKPNAKGHIEFTDHENETWGILYARQVDIVKKRACDEFMQGLDAIAFPKDRIPQCPDINAILKRTTGWSVQPVNALIETHYFFELLTERKFPVATFIRRREELNYLQEPDIFHEYFGHCTLLTNQAYADFLQWYGQMTLKHTSQAARQLLGRLFWFTIEFGLIKAGNHFRIYGGGILSSPGETVYAAESQQAERRPFVVEDALRTPYRVDIMQPIYYCLDAFDDLYRLMEIDLEKALKYAVEKGDFEPHQSVVGEAFDEMSGQSSC